MRIRPAMLCCLIAGLSCGPTLGRAHAHVVPAAGGGGSDGVLTHTHGIGLEHEHRAGASSAAGSESGSLPVRAGSTVLLYQADLLVPAVSENYAGAMRGPAGLVTERQPVPTAAPRSELDRDDPRRPPPRLSPPTSQQRGPPASCA